jgi:hypothetical protein
MKKGIVSVEAQGFPSTGRRMKLLEAFRRYKFVFAAFLIPLGIRAIPEIIVGPYPIGWDIIAYYIPNSLDLASGSMNVWGIITSPPLMYAIILPAHVLTRVSLVWILKILGPILYGFLGLSILTFCQRRLHWSTKKAFYAVLFISAYFVTMRISWDAYQAELGLGLFLLAQSIIEPPASVNSTLARVSLLSLAVFSNQLVGVLVVGTQLATLLGPSVRKSPRLVPLQFSPIALFLMILYATMQTPLAPGLSIVGPGATLSILTTNLSFLLYAYIFVVPLVLFGIKLRERSLFAPWMISCGIGLTLAVLPGHVFQDIGYRWVLLLSLPLLILAYEGYSKLGVSGAFMGRNWWRLLRVVIIVSLSSSAILYAVLPAESALPFYAMFPPYVPSSMVQSSLPSSDYPSVVSAMLWVDSHLSSDSVLITQQAFYGWARSYLSPDKQILNSLLASPNSVIGETGSYTHVFTIWWVSGTGWFHGSFPVGAKPLVSFGDLAVYEYR